MKKVANYKAKINQNKILKGSRGITLIALVITIIVLLILAAVSIATLTGDNGILTKAQDASERTREATAREQIEVEAVGSFDNNGKFNRETFKQRIQDIGGTVLSDDGNEIVVELDGYEAVIDAKTGEIKKFGKGVTLVVEATQGEVVGDKVTIEIEVKTDVDQVDSVTVTNLDTGKTYPATFSGKSGTVEVDSNGTYKIEVTATIDEVQKTGKTTIGVIVTPVEFTKEYGKIDVIWVNTENEKIDEPLAPVLNGENPMKKVYWEDDKTEKKEGEDGFEESKWYDYVAGNNDEDNTDSHWANAINTVNGSDSYFVWVPRYAYRIIYYADKECTKVAGYCDGDGTREVNGNIYNGEKAKAGIETVDYNGFKYIVHTSFEGNVENGGWKDEKVEDLQGIWVAKYEMSAEDSEGGNIETEWLSIGDVDITKNYNGNIARMVSKPGVTSWRQISIGNCYTNSFYYDRDKESHLMKNSEWGAVAYLTHSQYGRNGHEIKINSNNSCYTGGGQEDSYKNNTPQSNTGNIYGIYDLSGGAWEYVAAFNNEGSRLSNGSSFTSDSKSTKYATKYASESSTPSYDSYIPGDATYEVYTGSNAKAWFLDSSDFVNSDNPFFNRGGFYSPSTDAGVFFADCVSGYVNAYLSFRVVLAGF